MVGLIASAVPLFRDVVRLYRLAYGEHHARVATALNNLAVLLDKQGQKAEALKLGQRALLVARKVHGPNHETTKLYQRDWGV